jgi:hypothetical protein
MGAGSTAGAAPFSFGMEKGSGLERELSVWNGVTTRKRRQDRRTPKTAAVQP